MIKNKLITIIKGLSRKEMTRFSEFAFSPYFNKHKAVRHLVSYLSDIFPCFDEKNCYREVVLQRLKDAEVRDHAKLALVFTYTFRLVEKFLIHERFKEEILHHNLLLLKDLRERKRNAFYEKELDKAQKLLEKQTRQDSHFFDQQYQLAREADYYYQQIQKRQKDLNMQKKQNSLDRFYLSEKLKDACEMYLRAKILKVDYNTGLLKAVLQGIESNLENYKKVPAVLLYYQLYRMVVEDSEGHYFEAFTTLKINQNNFSLDEKKYIFNLFQNFCIQRINQGEEQFLQESFKLFQSQLDQDLLIEEGFLSQWHYKNIVTTGIRLREMDWVKNFIEKYQDKLPLKDRDNAYRFNLASYYYATKQLDEVLNLLIKVEYSDLRYNLGAKALLLRTYYDMEENDALYSLADSFKQYLHRNKLMSESKKVGYFNLFRLTRKAALVRANLSFVTKDKNKKELEKLYAESEKAQTIFNKLWLMEKIHELQLELN